MFGSAVRCNWEKERISFRASHVRTLMAYSRIRRALGLGLDDALDDLDSC